MNQHLHQFAQQLSIWTEAIIEHGRTPFRRVDTHPEIDTDQGIKRPPLVFWINRQSMMAGGILLLPENNLKIELETGRSCATALGLRHFVTWETDRVRIWQIEQNLITEHQAFPLTSPNHPETFRHLLAEVLEALKLLAVLGAIPANNLSPCYFNNLFQITLEQALSPLTKAYRSQRFATEQHATEDTDSCANEANKLFLLQVLSVLWFNSCPDAMLPEKMECVLERSLQELPDPLQQTLVLKTTPNAPSFPLESAVIFHHLLLRLRQLSWNHENERARNSLHRLSRHWFPDQVENDAPVAVHLYPQAPILDTETRTLLSNSPSLLAISALIAATSNLSPKKIIFGNLFELDRDSLPEQFISARLLNQNGIATFERLKYTTMLRTAWPNRHLKIKAGQPFWHWELIHLLGLSHTWQNLSLELPADLINNPANQLAWSLLNENFSFQHLHSLNNGNIKLKILRDTKTRKSFPVQIEGEIREIHPLANPTGFKNQLILALNLPGAIYKLLGDELVWPEPGTPENQLPGWETYSQSRLYKWIEAILPIGISENNTTPEANNSCIPYPAPPLLKELATIKQADIMLNQSAAIDHFLADLLACPAVANIASLQPSKPRKDNESERISEKKLKETIVQALTTYGIPNFPEQYLYFLDQPETIHYSFAPPLTITNNLLGEFELQDSQDQIITGYGEELKQILLICAGSGKAEIDLPTNRHQLEQLLQYYLKDLKALHEYLSKLCYSQIKNSATARKVINSTWKNLKLPKIA